MIVEEFNPQLFLGRFREGLHATAASCGPPCRPGFCRRPV